jgi:hypothetical protein
MNRTAAEVEAEVEASRSELDRNVEALKQKMTPGQLFDEAARLMGGTGQQVASKFVEQAKANPMPLAVMGLGLAWLMASNNRAPSYGERRSFAPGDEYGYGWEGDQAAREGGGLKEKAAGAGETASHALSSAREKLSAGAGSMADRGRAAGQQLGSATSAARERAGQVAHQAQRTFQQTLESEPLLIAGLGLIVGAAIGASLPSTAAEDRVMGEARDRVVGKGKDLAQTGLQKASGVAQTAYGAVKSELQTDSGGGLEERVEGAVRAGVEAARDEAQAPPAH